MRPCYIVVALFLTLAGAALAATGQERSSSACSSSASRTARDTAAALAATHGSAQPVTASASASEARDLRLEGEKRFRNNCGRCHMPPHKFPPRVMAAAIRHMRVRAMITDEDMRLILRYMTE